jgi:plasmid stabilization system protein ParE
MPGLDPGIHAAARTVMISDRRYYFTVDDENAEVEILAVFCGGQDHLRLHADRVARR